MARIAYARDRQPLALALRQLRRAVCIARRRQLRDGLTSWTALAARDRQALERSCVIVDALWLCSDAQPLIDWELLRDLVTLRACIRSRGRGRLDYVAALAADLEHYVAELS